MESTDTGFLLNKHNIELNRKYFTEMTKLLGINVIFRSPKLGKTWNRYGELDAAYNDPIVVGCIFEEHPTIWTFKKLGWSAEQSQDSALIHVPYDLENLQVGSLFIIPSGIDNTEGRIFRVIRMSTIAVYPASITCELAPEFASTFEESQHNFENTSTNLLREEE